MSTVFQIYKGSIRWNLIFPNPIWDIFGKVTVTVSLFNNCFKKKFSCIRKFAEQTTKIFLKMFLNYSKTLYINSGALIECFYGMIFEELLYSFSRKLLKVCSGSVLEDAKVYSRTVLEQTIRTFLELFWNHSKNVPE